MTISYSGNFFKLLLRWKGSIWKAVWVELLVFIIIYGALSILYRFGLPVGRHHDFETLCVLLDSYSEKIPLNFVLGFYVNVVVRRWWEQFQFVAWPDDILVYVNIMLPGFDPRIRNMRRTIARWLCLTAALSWRDISKSVRRRFPTIEHLTAGGLMTKQELEIYNKVTTDTIRWSLPLFWVRSTVENEIRMRTERSPAGPVVAQFYREINSYRNCFRSLYCYDWVCIPLVYTQVAALATYGYFVLCLLGKQFINPERGRPGNLLDLYFPIFTVLQFIFYVGWFKVGQYLMRPFEEDDDDIELNYMLDRHVQTAYSIVDEVLRLGVPPLDEAQDGEENLVPVIPYTRMSIRRQQHPPKLHVNIAKMKKTDEEVIDLDTESLTVSNGGFKRQRRPSRIRQF